MRNEKNKNLLGEPAELQTQATPELALTPIPQLGNSAYLSN